MRISTTTGPFIKHFSFEETIDMLADVGFEALDFSAAAEEFCTDVHDKYYYEELKKRACDKGVIFNQAHAPHPSSYIDAEKNTERFKALVTSMKNASYLGVETIIVHPAQHLEFHIPGNPEILFEYNMEFYRKLIPYCEEYGIKIATENMWQYPGTIGHSTCSRPEEFIRYLDELNNDCFVGCLDIGHSMLVKEQPYDFIRALGAEPVIYPYRNECCGGYISLKEKQQSRQLCDRITESAAGFDADCLVTACPLCKYNLNQSGKLPIVYFTELLAEALGVKEEGK